MGAFANLDAQASPDPLKKGPAKRGNYMLDQFLGSMGLGPKVNAKDYGKTDTPAMERLTGRAVASVPLGDEISDAATAATGALLHGRSYGDEFKSVRAHTKARNDETAAKYPGLNLGGEVLPTALTLGAAGAGYAGAEAMGGAADQGLLQLGNTAKPLAGEGAVAGLARKGANLGRKGLLGGMGGYVSGLTGEGDLKQRASDAANLILPGFAGGIILPSLFEGGTKLANAAFRKGSELFNPTTMVGSERLPAKSAAKAGRILANRAPGSADPKLQGAQFEGQLPYERWGEGGNSVAKATANVPGPGQQIAKDTLYGRRKGAVGRMQRSVQDATGATGADFYPVKETAKAMRSASTDPLYRESAETPINAVDFETHLGDLLRTDVGQRAMASAQRIAESDQASTGKRIAWPQTIVRNGQVEMTHPPTADVLDYISQGFDEQLKPHRNQFGKLQDLTPEGRATVRLRDAFVDRLGQLVPKNAEARGSWADQSRSLDALEFGRKAVGSKFDPEQIAARTYENRPEDNAAQLTGVARGLNDKLMGPNPRATFRSFENDPTAMQRLRSTFPEGEAGDAAFNALHGQGTREAEFEHQLADKVSGSRTTPLKEDIAATNAAGEEDPGIGVMAAEALAKKAGGQGFIRQGFRAAADWKAKKGAALNDPVVSRLLGEVLYQGRDPQQVLAAAVKRQIIRPQDVKELAPFLSSAAGYFQQQPHRPTAQEGY